MVFIRSGTTEDGLAAVHVGRCDEQGDEADDAGRTATVRAFVYFKVMFSPGSYRLDDPDLIEARAVPGSDPAALTHAGASQFPATLRI